MGSRCFRFQQVGRRLLMSPAATARPTMTLAPPPSPAFGMASLQKQRSRSCTTLDSGALVQEPQPSPRFGLLKLFATVFTGVSIGAWISKKMAAFLEENELFVPDDDDDDDD